MARRHPFMPFQGVETYEVFVKSEEELRQIFNIPNIPKDEQSAERERVCEQHPTTEGGEQQLHNIPSTSIEPHTPKHSLGGASNQCNRTF